MAAFFPRAVFAAFLLLTACTQFPSRKLAGGLAESAGEGKLHLEVSKFTLDNGLTLLVYENNRLPIVSYHTFFDVGSRHESSAGGTTGAVHFLEHMMFKGTKNNPPEAFEVAIDGSGGSSNAGTSTDMTVYHENVPIHQLDEVIRLEADRMVNLTLERNSFESERKVIMEERKMRLENSPEGQIFTSVLEIAFKGSPYGRSVIGSQRDLENLRRDQVMDFYHNFYTPDNAIIVVVGDVKAQEVFEKVKAAYGSFKPSSAEIKAYRRKVEDPDRYHHAKEWPSEVRLHGASPVPMFFLVYEGVSMSHPRGFVLDMLSSVLFLGASSHFNQRYVKTARPLLADIHSGHLSFKHNGLFIVNGQLLPKVSLAKFRRDLMGELRKKACDAKVINERSLQQTKNQYLQVYYRAVQSNEAVADFLGRREFHFGDYSFYKKELEAYQSITVQEVREACEQMFSGRSAFISLWNRHPKRGG